VADGVDGPSWRPARVGLVGGGVIGGGWAARLVLNGIDVCIHDPAPDASRRVEELLAGARRAFASLTTSPLPPEGSLRVCDSIEEAVVDVDFVQESVPERLELKQELLATISLHARDDAPIASSTSGLRPTDLQAGMRLPERLLVGHPFNPVYLIPLVELCAGERTAPSFLDRAADLYRAIGMRPLRVRREIDGFLADRLLEALWREALWLVHDGVATVSELDDAIRYGAGLRWAFMGTFLTYRIAGGELGMRHFLAQFGPALALPWTKLTDVPELTDEFIDELVTQSDEQAAGRSIAELERARDACLVSLLQGLRSTGVGAGATLASWERGLMSPVAVDAREGERVPAPLELVAREIPPSWMDYNGHMTESRYLDLFSEATDGLLRWIGVTGEYLQRGRSYFTVETHISHLAQLFAQDRVRVSTQLLGHDHKRLHVFHVITRRAGEEDQVVAAAEQMMVHVDLAGGSSTPADPQVLARVASLSQAHAALPRPERAGRRISLS